jgi:hypothetical protein
MIIGNLIVAVLHMPFTAITAAAGQWIFGQTDQQKDGVCSFVGLIFAFGIGFSVQLLAVISFDRFLFVVKPLLYKRFMKLWVAFLIVAFVAVEVLITALTPAIGFGEYSFAEAVASCVPLWTDVGHLLFISSVGCVVFAVIAVTSLWTFCFTKNFFKKERDNQVECQSNANGIADHQIHLYHVRLCNLISVFGVMLLVIIICFSPYAIASTISFIIGADNVPDPLYCAVLIFAYMNTILNPIVQAYFRPEISKRVKQMLSHGKCLCHKQINILK